MEVSGLREIINILLVNSLVRQVVINPLTMKPSHRNLLETPKLFGDKNSCTMALELLVQIR
jgi:hypothetical protein